MSIIEFDVMSYSTCSSSAGVLSPPRPLRHSPPSSSAATKPPPILVAQDGDGGWGLAGLGTNADTLAITIPTSPFELEKAVCSELEQEAVTRAWQMHFRVMRKGLLSPSPAEEEALTELMGQLGDALAAPEGTCLEPTRPGEDLLVFALEW